MILSNLQIQVWAQDVFLPILPPPEIELGFVVFFCFCCFIAFHQRPMGTGLDGPSPGSFRDIGKEDLGGALCFFGGGCRLPFQVHVGRERSWNSHPAFSSFLGGVPVQPWKQTRVRTGSSCVYGSQDPLSSTSPHPILSDSLSILAYFFPASVQWRLPWERKVSSLSPPWRHLSFLRCQASWLPSNLPSPLD